MWIAEGEEGPTNIMQLTSAALQPAPPGPMPPVTAVQLEGAAQLSWPPLSAVSACGSSVIGYTVQLIPTSNVSAPVPPSVSVLASQCTATGTY